MEGAPRRDRESSLAGSVQALPSWPLSWRSARILSPYSGRAHTHTPSTPSPALPRLSPDGGLDVPLSTLHSAGLSTSLGLLSPQP